MTYQAPFKLTGPELAVLCLFRPGTLIALTTLPDRYQQHHGCPLEVKAAVAILEALRRKGWLDRQELPGVTFYRLTDPVELLFLALSVGSHDPLMTLPPEGPES